MKVIVAGAGEAGTYLADLLYKAKKNIIILDTNKERLNYIDSHYDFLTHQGSATSIFDLNSIGIAQTDLFIALTHIEEVNITAGILAKKMGAKKVITRIDNREYLELENVDFFKELGIDSLIYPEILASDEIVNLLSKVGVSKSYSFENGKLFLFAIKIKENAPILYKTLQEVTKESGDFEFRAVAITRDQKTIIPKGFNAFHEGDMFYVICKPEAVNKLMTLSAKKTLKLKIL